MITSMRVCVAYNDLWPWPLSSRSFGLGLENRVRSVVSAVPDGIFPYLVQMITSMRRCVACDDLWPWPISSRSFDLDLENRVRSVEFWMDSFYIWHNWSLSLEGVLRVTFFAESENLNFWQIFEIFRTWPWKKSTVLDGFFPYLAQIIISIRGCVACNDLWPWPIFSRSFGLDLENRVCSVASTVLHGFFPYLVQMITSMRRCVACHDLWLWPISSRSFDLILTWGIQHDLVVWVIIEVAGGIVRTQAF